MQKGNPQLKAVGYEKFVTKGFCQNGTFESLKQKISGKGLKIVFPEGTDARILGAANRLNADGLITPVFIGSVKKSLKH